MYFHRRSVRLDGFDYSENGIYFVTICSQNRKKLFGEIENSQMVLSKNGLILKIWLSNLINRFNIQIDDYQIMPNHLHVIIEILMIKNDLNVGAIHESPLIKNKIQKTLKNNDLNDGVNNNFDNGSNMVLNNRADNILNNRANVNLIERAHFILNNRAHRDAPLQRSMLSKIIGYLKMNVSKEIGICVWQRNYYEHIIRNEKEYLRIKEYIKLNPEMWDRDRNNI